MYIYCQLRIAIYMNAEWYFWDCCVIFEKIYQFIAIEAGFTIIVWEWLWQVMLIHWNWSSMKKIPFPSAATSQHSISFIKQHIEPTTICCWRIVGAFWELLFLHSSNHAIILNLVEVNDEYGPANRPGCQIEHLHLNCSEICWLRCGKLVKIAKLYNLYDEKGFIRKYFQTTHTICNEKFKAKYVRHQRHTMIQNLPSIACWQRYISVHCSWGAERGRKRTQK